MPSNSSSSSSPFKGPGGGCGGPQGTRPGPGGGCGGPQGTRPGESSAPANREDEKPDKGISSSGNVRNKPGRKRKHFPLQSAGSLREGVSVASAAGAGERGPPEKQQPVAVQHNGDRAGHRHHAAVIVPATFGCFPKQEEEDE
ncbi:hypothetical protein CRUP_001011, partial [Coryphaenoides rupestris]